MRTKTGSILIQCDGCPESVIVELHAPPPSGWARVTFEEFKEGRQSGEVIDLGPKCVATLPWRKS